MSDERDEEGVRGLLLTPHSSLPLNLFRAVDLPFEPLDTGQMNPAGIAFVEHQIAGQTFMAGQGGADHRAGNFDQVIELCAEETATPPNPSQTDRNEQIRPEPMHTTRF